MWKPVDSSDCLNHQATSNSSHIKVFPTVFKTLSFPLIRSLPWPPFWPRYRILFLKDSDIFSSFMVLFIKQKQMGFYWFCNCDFIVCFASPRSLKEKVCADFRILLVWFLPSLSHSNRITKTCRALCAEEKSPGTLKKGWPHCFVAKYQKWHPFAGNMSCNENISWQCCMYSGRKQIPKPLC